MLECNVIVNKLVKGSFVIIVIGKGSLLSDTVGGAWVSSTCTVFAYTEHLRAGADPVRLQHRLQQVNTPLVWQECERALAAVVQLHSERGCLGTSPTPVHRLRLICIREPGGDGPLY